MQIVQLLIAADRVHIGVDAMTRLDAVLTERHSLPFCQRLYDFHFQLVDILQSERHAAFHAIQIIIEAGFRVHEQRRGYAAQVQTICQFLLEIVFDFFDRSLALHQVDRTFVVFW